MLTRRIDGWAVRVARETRGFSATELARKAGVSVPTISLIENGKRQPSATLARRITKALGVSLDDITAAEGDEDAA